MRERRPYSPPFFPSAKDRKFGLPPFSPGSGVARRVKSRRRRASPTFFFSSSLRRQKKDNFFSLFFLCASAGRLLSFLLSEQMTLSSFSLFLGIADQHVRRFPLLFFPSPRERTGLQPPLCLLHEIPRFAVRPAPPSSPFLRDRVSHRDQRIDPPFSLLFSLFFPVLFF